MPRTSESPTSSPAATVDLTSLAERVGDASFVAPIVEVFLDLLPSRLGSICGAANTPSTREERVRAAHSLKSASALLGLMDLSTTCARLESAWRNDPGAATAALVVDVQVRGAQARAALEGALAVC